MLHLLHNPYVGDDMRHIVVSNDANIIYKKVQQNIYFLYSYPAAAAAEHLTYKSNIAEVYARARARQSSIAAGVLRFLNIDRVLVDV